MSRGTLGGSERERAVRTGSCRVVFGPPVIGRNVPALRREGMATQRTRSSRSRHCLAIRMATKVARESWNDRSLTWGTGTYPLKPGGVN